MSWVCSIAVKPKGEIVRIDGKTVSGNVDAKTKAIHMVGAQAEANQLALGQVKTDEKSNEITAILVNKVYAITGFTSVKRLYRNDRCNELSERHR